MCLIIVNNNNVKIADYIIESALDYNPDGVGIMYGNKVVKMLSPTVDTVISALNNIKTGYAIHFRMATHGRIKKSNCHPFPSKFGHLMHNGVLSFGNGNNPEMTDTEYYIKTYINKCSALNPEAIGAHIGKSNKFVINKNGKFTIINEDSGHWKNDLWFSNAYAYSEDYEDYGHSELKWSIVDYLNRIGFRVSIMTSDEKLAEIIDSLRF